MHFFSKGDPAQNEDAFSKDLPSLPTQASEAAKHEAESLESFDFIALESLIWRKHQFRRYFQGKGKNHRITIFWKWALVIITGLLVAFTGAFVSVFTEILTVWKFSNCHRLMEQGEHGGAFFALQFFSLFLALIAGGLCWYQPAAGGSGIPEIKAFLNGVNVSKVVKMPILAAKVIGMCFSVAAGLPLGKEGPMIHVGSIIGAAVSQGNALNLGFDTSWNIFQDLRNDYTKRDFVTYGAAAGVAAAFRAPIGGILFALEEGASFWSTSTTFRSFMCAVVTQLSIGLIFPKKATSSTAMFALGQFDNFFDGRSNYYVYELPMFLFMGFLGGLLGAFFNYINMHMTMYRMKHLNGSKLKRMLELCLITFIMSFVSFVLPLFWQVCTPIPEPTGESTVQEINLMEELVPFQCKEGYYNQLASLYFTPGDTAMRQLFHFREVNGEGLASFTSGPLILFFVPYFLIAAITSGVMAPAGLFVPTLLAGAAYGRLIGHWMNTAFPGHVADAGTYALIGAASVLGGMARMTIAGCVIILEACGNITYLLPLMVTFAASRYAGNAINEPMYDMQIRLKEMPFLEGSLQSLGMLNYHPVSKIMAHPVVTLNEIEKVRRVMEVLTTTAHNGFPVVNREGRLRGIILRKTLCSLLKLKAYSIPNEKNGKSPEGEITLTRAATVFYDTLERPYPNYPDINSIRLTEKEMSYWLDMRSYMDPSPHVIDDNASIQRCYRFFRTMGLRHLIALDGEHRVIGMITRKDITEHRLSKHWIREGVKMQKLINIDPLEQGMVSENAGLLEETQHEFENTSTINERDITTPIILEGNDKPSVTFNDPLSPQVAVDESSPSIELTQIQQSNANRINARQQQKELREPKSMRTNF